MIRNLGLNATGMLMYACKTYLGMRGVFSVLLRKSPDLYMLRLRVGNTTRHLQTQWQSEHWSRLRNKSYKCMYSSWGINWILNLSYKKRCQNPNATELLFFLYRLYHYASYIYAQAMIIVKSDLHVGCVISYARSRATLDDTFPCPVPPPLQPPPTTLTLQPPRPSLLIV